MWSAGRFVGGSRASDVDRLVSSLFPPRARSRTFDSYVSPVVRQAAEDDSGTYDVPQERALLGAALWMGTHATIWQ